MEEKVKYNPKGGRPKLSGEEKQKYKRIYLTLSKKEFEKLEKQHSKFAISRANYIRYKLFNDTNKLLIRDKDYLQFRRELNRIGLNLNQIAKHLNTSPDDQDIKGTKVVFEELIELFVKIEMNL